MDDVKCPRCRGPLETRMDGGDHWIGPVSAGAWCRSCGEEWRQAEDMEHLAHWEPRDRLPTPEEEAAHAARHGDAAGWMIRWVDTTSDRHWFSGHDMGMGLDLAALRAIARPCESYPHVDGRPVGWPEVKT